MRKKYYHLLSLAVLPLVAGCTVDEQIERTDGKVPIHMTVAVDDITRAADGLHDGNFASGETFYVYFDGDASTVDHATYTTKDASGNTNLGTGSTQPYFKAGETSVTAYAYFPSSVTNNSTLFTVEQVQDQTETGTANYNKSDLMYAEPVTVTKSSTSNTAEGSLSFTHRMAKIKVVAKASGSGVTKIKAVRIIGGSRTINITTPKTCTLGTTLENPNSTSSYVTMYDNATGEATVTCAAVLPPQSLSGDFLQVETDAGTATYAITKSIASNNCYTLELNITAAAINTRTTIADWNSVNVRTINHASVLDLSTLTADKTITENTILTGTTDKNITIAPDVYVVLKNATISTRLQCTGSADIALSGINSIPKGITPGPSGHTLNLSGDGSLTINNVDNSNSGIGATNANACGDITINSGSYTITASYLGAGIGASGTKTCGDIIINGGTITTTGGIDAAGIGGGNASCGSIEINGGDIKATGRTDAAGIGAGCDGNCENISIFGGEIISNATGGGAGIGSGNSGKCNDIIIYGGIIEASGGCGIGTGTYLGSHTIGNIEIMGGSISAIGNSCAGIGSGGDCGCGNITIGENIIKVVASKRSSYSLNHIGKGCSESSCGAVIVHSSLYDTGEGGTERIITLVHPYKVPTTLSELNATITSGFDCSLLIGKIIASDGSLHNNVSSATSAGKTASAMIAYIGNMNNGNGAYSTTYNHGLAIALTDVSNTSGDEGTNYFGTESAPVACMNYKRARPTNSSSWMLPNIYQWERILIACGSSATYISSVAEGGQYSFGYGNLRTYLTN